MYTKEDAEFNAAKIKIQTKWLLSPSFRDDWCNKYFVLFWAPQYFREKVSEFGNGFIKKDSEMYKVIYHNCTAEEVIQTKNQLALSFRAPARDLDINNVVLVNITNTSSFTRKQERKGN